MSSRSPLPRLPRRDILDPAIEDFAQLALLRMYHIAVPDCRDTPPRLFPLAESTRWDFFTCEEWSKYGDLETEDARLTYTLTTYPQRGAPAASTHTLRGLLQQSSVLMEWPNIAPSLQAQARSTVELIVDAQYHHRRELEYTTKADFLTVPVDYDTNSSSSEISLELWKRSLVEIAQQLADVRSIGTAASLQVHAFLQIHAYLKDCMYGLRKPLKMQQFFFSYLLNQFQTCHRMDGLNLEVLSRVAAQAAQESAYLSCPLLERVTLIHFKSHHQLPYANVPLNSLTRAEFSLPLHVLEVAEELLQATAMNDGQACPLVPILVTTRPSFSDEAKYLIPIVDGNHRATASILLRFLAGQPLQPNLSLMLQHLLTYCKTHSLHRKWEIDLSDVLHELYSPAGRHFYETFLAKRDLVCNFSPVHYIPALIVEEENFHTICKQRSQGKIIPVMLLPFHQTLLNDEKFSFALPQKAGQTHGRPEAFRLMSLFPFGSLKEDIKTDANIVFEAKLRSSMHGLEP